MPQFMRALSTFNYINIKLSNQNMPLKVTCKKLQRGPFQKLLYTIESTFDNLRHFSNATSGNPLTIQEKQLVNCVFDNMVEVCLEFEHTLSKFNPGQENSVQMSISIAAKTVESLSDKHHTIILKVTCKEFNFSGQITCTGKWLEFIFIGEKEVILGKEHSLVLTDIEINLSVIKLETVTFAKLYDDTVLSDFQLSTETGSVAMHKVCLAAHSDVIKTMFNGPWKETADGRVGLGVTLNSLQHFKDYIYLGKLPDAQDDLQPLLLLSSLYSMETLKAECISKLMELVKPENVYSFLEFASKNNIPDLSFAMLLQVPDDVVHKSYELKKSK